MYVAWLKNKLPIMLYQQSLAGYRDKHKCGINLLNLLLYSNRLHAVDQRQIYFNDSYPIYLNLDIEFKIENCGCLQVFCTDFVYYAKSTPAEEVFERAR